MEITKSIPELFFDRCIAEGGTLHVWFGGARFKRMTTKLKVRGCIHDREWEELNHWGFIPFVPSDELATIYKRNHRAISEWLESKRVEWCREAGVMA